jgi:hypothetical protein
MTSWLGLAARLVLVLLLVASPAISVIVPADSRVIPGVSDGADGGGGDDGTRVVHTPVVTPSTFVLRARPAMASAQFRILGSTGPSDPARRPGSSRSPPQR